ncbi:hypothetical protein FRC17_000361 [Serendipita sp. 399]|nr:hypothetical protein FRC17_000361 [Serendipita sp. 399]
MVKFTDANDQNYRKVIDYLPELLDRGPARVRENWIRERSHRSIATGVLPPSQTAVLTKPLPPVSKSYIQRADISIFLTRRLLPPTPGEHQPRCVLHGSSGSGKTQLAVAWIEVHKDRFNMIIVIDASSRQQIETDLQTAIRSVGPQYNKATWKDAVAYLSREVNWLLFFDNADEPNLSLDRYLPNSRSGAVLVTTRNRDYATYAPDGHVEVEALTEKQAMDLLHKIIGTSPPSTSASLAIVRELEMWPLSVTQAGLYIRTSHLDTYLADLRMHRDELRQATSLEGNDHLWSKYAAFNLSFAQLPKKSQEWMKICAFLRHSSIPLSLFRSSNRVEFRAPTIMITQPPLDDDELAISRLRGIFGSDWDNSSFQQLVDPISRTSFIDTSDNDGQSFYKIHSLVQLFIQDLLGPADRERYALLASQLVLGTIRPLEGGESNIWYRQILPHIEALPMRAKTSHISHALAYHMVYKSVGNWDATQQLEKHCCDHFYQRYGPTYPGTLDMMGSLATTFRHRGQLEEAEKLGREVLQRRTEIVGLKHSDTILSMNNLSLTLSARGKLREAEEMKRKVLELRKETSGPDHPDTIAAMGNYASALHSRGALREAEKIEREVVELRKRTGGLQDLTTIIAMRNLALTLKKLDQLEDAEKMMREVLALLEVALGPRHLETMKAKSGLATMLQSAPQLEEAEKLEREVLEFQAEELGERHPDTMTTMHNLAVTLHHRGDLVGSEKMTRHVLRLQMDVLGPRNADTILTMSTLGFILHRRGQWAEAEKMLREALKLRKDMFGIQNRYTIDIMSNLVVTLYCRGQLEEAEEKQRVIVAWRMENLGPRDANTIDAKSRLAKFSAELAYRIQNAAGGL